MKSIQMKQLIICVFALILTTNFLSGQTPIPCGETTISSLIGTTYTIQDELTSLIIYAEGGDGGGARRDVGFCNTRRDGGAGALIAAEFEIGTQADQLQAGGLLKTVVGRVGGEGSRVCSFPGEGPAGGGGGSTAVLYLPPGENASGTNWRVLMVASGGGGATRWTDFKFYGGGGGQTNLASPGDGDCGDYIDANEDSCNYPGAGYACSSLPYNGDGCFASGAGKTFVDNYLTNPLRVQLKADSEASNTGGADVENISGGDNGGGDGFTGGGGSVNEWGGGGGGFTGGNANVTGNPGNPGIGLGGSSYLTDDYNNTLISATAGTTGAGTGSNGYVRFITPDITSISCKSTLDVSLDVNGNALLTASDLDDGSVFSCGEYISFFNGNTPFSGYAFICLDIGSNFNLNVYILDEDDNPRANCMSVVSVVDDMVPNAKCRNRTVQLDASGNASITVGNINNGSKDNCGIASRVLDKTTFTCDDIGANTVTLTVTDNYNNTNTCTATVTVEDNILPVASCKDVTLQLDATGNATLTVDDVDDGSDDNCGIQSSVLSKTTFDCTNIGANSVTLTITDSDETVSTCFSNVTVEDNIAPTINCQDVTIQLNGNGQAFLDFAAVDAGGGGDNCGGSLNAIVTPTSFDCSNVGANTVTFSAADAQNNVATCTSIVTVEDNSAPQVTCKDATVALDPDGNYTLLESDILSSFSDNCNSAVFEGASPATVSCTDLGTSVTVTASVNDGNGNTTTCTSVVTVEFVQPSCTAGFRFWTGAIDSDWNNPCNWNPTCVPTTDDVVIVVDATWDPLVLAGVNAFAKEVKVELGGALRVDGGGRLTINGSTLSGLEDKGEFENYGILNIDNVAFDGISMTSTATFNNWGTVNIGQNTGTIGRDGILNNGGTFNNFSGTINIDNTNEDAIYHRLSPFTNDAIINIGMNAGNIGQNGIYNFDGTMINTAEGQIFMDNITLNGILNNSAFDNYGFMSIGVSTASIGGIGLSMTAPFTNHAEALIFINNTGAQGILNESTLLQNDGLLLVGTNGPDGNVTEGLLVNNGQVENNGILVIRIQSMNP